MKRNLTQLGPLVLPLSEQFKVGYSLLLKFFKRGQSRYVPSFKTAFDFFCIHAVRCHRYIAFQHITP